MNHGRFDALVRSLSTARSRRETTAILAGGVSSALMLIVDGEAPSPVTARKGRREAAGVVAEGPCGNGSAKKNRCRRNRQCCTGYCKKKHGKNKKGKNRGRCRCRSLNETCTDDRNCCAGHSGNHCLEGRCLPDPILGCAEHCNEGERCWQGQCVCGDVCANGCQFATVQAAIGATAAGSTIRLCAETYGSITVSKSLTLLGTGSGGGGSVLDGAGSGPVVEIDSGITVVLQALRVTGGGAAELGSGIYTNGNLTLADCAVTGNQARECAGIFNDGALTLSGTEVTANTSEGDGGGICVLDSGTANIRQSTISGNTAGGNGGGIFNGGISVTLDAQTSVINNSPNNCWGNPVAGCTG